MEVFLNPEQKRAVDTTEGPVMVVAGPGTGKTKILTLRIGSILQSENNTAPESILALTYTTAGVVSMRERLIETIGDQAYRVNIFTFHAFCEHLIKEFSLYFEALEGSKVIGDLERVEIIESILKAHDFKNLVSFHDEFSFLAKIADGILAIKKEGLSPEKFLARLPEWEKELLSSDELYYKKNYGEYKKGDIKPAEKQKVEKKIAKAKELAEIFVLYQSELQKRGLYDFSDMILYVLDKLVRNKDFKADVQEKYQYLLVDEHQDTNEGQNTIIELLTDAPHLEGKPNLFTVGDEKQSIYRFQGASKETFSRFSDLYNDIQHITLSENYRSTQHILDAAQSLIVKSPDHGNSTALHSNKKENQKIAVREFSSYKFELLHLAEDIQSKIREGVPPSEIAVLYRANKNISDIKTILDFANIPYTIFSKDKILDDANIKNLIYILKVVLNPDDNHHLAKALFTKFLHLDAYDTIKILDRHKSLRGEEKVSIFSIINDGAVLQELGIKNAETFSDFAETIKELKIESLNQGFVSFFKLFLDKIQYIPYMLAATDSRLQLLKVDKLFEEIKRQAESKKEYGLDDFVYFIDSFAKYNLDIKSSDPEIIEGVSLMTAHGSKGREFEHVYIINATRKSWESRRGGGSGITLPIYQYDGDMEDERRLFYVAMTRAKKTLSISFARTGNDGKEQEESQFVTEIDPSCKEELLMKEFEQKHVDELALFLRSEKRSISLFDPEYLRALFFKRGLNVSALNNYLDCPRKYLYKNLIRIPDVYSLSQLFGNVVDSALNNFFDTSKKESAIASKSALIGFFEKALYAANLPEKEENKFRERGIKSLSGYYDEYAGTWTPHVDMQLYVERDFELADKQSLKISGMIDKIEYIEGMSSDMVNVVDHKTGKAFSEKSKDQKTDYERQLSFYSLLLAGYEKRDFRVRKSVLDFVERNEKTGKFEQHAIDVTPDRIAALSEEIHTCAREVLSMEFLDKGCGKKECEWCQFKPY